MFFMHNCYRFAIFETKRHNERINKQGTIKKIYAIAVVHKNINLSIFVKNIRF